jgi:LEA14-like dessication related protein
MEGFKSQVMYNYRLMIICQISAKKYPCRVQVITESFLQKLQNSAKTSVTMDDLSAEIYTHDVQIKKAGLYLYYIAFV